MILTRFSLKYQFYLVYVYSLYGNISYLLIIYYNIDSTNMVHIFRIHRIIYSEISEIRICNDFHPV